MRNRFLSWLKDVEAAVYVDVRPGNTKPVLSLQEAETILQRARLEAERHGWSVSIAVVDAGGHPLGLFRLDNSDPVSTRQALEKARAAALAKRETGGQGEGNWQGDDTGLSTPQLQGMCERGVPIMRDDVYLGAIGVSGALPAQDLQIARAGAAAVIPLYCLPDW